MDRAATPGNHMEPQLVVVSIASGLIGVIVVAMIIYLCCFNTRRNLHQSGIPGIHPDPKIDLHPATNGGNGTLKRGKNVIFGTCATVFDSFRVGRSGSVESNQVIIERYTPSSKFPPDFFYPSGSNSSASNCRVSISIHPTSGNSEHFPDWRF